MLNASDLVPRLIVVRISYDHGGNTAQIMVEILHRSIIKGLETGHVSHTFYGRRLCAVNIIMDSTF